MVSETDVLDLGNNYLGLKLLKKAALVRIGHGISLTGQNLTYWTGYILKEIICITIFVEELILMIANHGVIQPIPM